MCWSRTAVSAFTALSKPERQTLDDWRIAKEEKEALEAETNALQQEIQALRVEQHHNELARKQLLMYAQDVQLLIQRLFEESYKTFRSTNLIHRSDGKVPQFFNDLIPTLPKFYKDLDL